MSDCVFEDDFRVSTPDRRLDFNFYHCTFAQGCIAQIRLGLPQDRPLFFEIENSIIAGRVDILPPETDEQQLPSPPVNLSLVGSVIAGELDVSLIQIANLNLRNASIPNGVVMLAPSLVRSFGVLKWWHVAPDQCNILVCEKTPLTSEAEFDEASKQFGELRNAYARTSSTIEQEEFCHYKFKDYRNRARVARLGGAAAYRWRLAILLGVAAVFFIFLWLALNSLLAEEFMKAITIVLIPVVIGSFFLLEPPPLLGQWLGKWFPDRRKVGDVLEITWDSLIYKWLLGYGVYARRVVVTAVGLIFFFAFLYWLISAFWPDWGHVQYDKENFILPWAAERPVRPTPDCPVHAGTWAALRQSLYFSVITFTTVGYGDYSAAGNMQYLAALEAFLGAALIATLIAVMARKFIR